MEWVTNAPRRDRYVPTTDAIEACGGEAGARQAYFRWRDRFAEGEPKATDTYSVEALKGLGMVGLYRRAPAGAVP